MNELLEQLTMCYFKARRYITANYMLMINKEDTIKNQEVKDDMLCKYWYLMVDSPKN